MINRRNFLKNASLFTLGGLMAGKVGNAVAAQPATSAAFEATAAKNIGLQIYSLVDFTPIKATSSTRMFREE